MKLKFRITDNHYFSLHSQFLLDLTLFTSCKWDIAKKKKYSELKTLPWLSYKRQKAPSHKSIYNWTFFSSSDLDKS